MVGQGALLECLRDPDVVSVLSVVRAPTGQRDAKLVEVIHADFQDFSSLESQFAGYDACFFCLGVTSAGMTEEAYTRVTYNIAVAAARSLLKMNPGMTFIFVSGMGTDSSEQGRTMWARVKGKTENAILGMGFKGAYMFRPGFIQPLDGIRSKTRIYQIILNFTAWLFPILKALFPSQVTTTQQLGRAMLSVARNGYPKPILAARDITTF
jgi:uncharacterized protein YbjT (DUF2867 family)